MAIEAVIFDWGGTLTPWHRLDPLDGLRCVARRYDPSRVEELATALLEAETALWALPWRTRPGGTLVALCEQVGITADESLLRVLHDWWVPHTLTDPGAAAVLTALRDRGMRVGLLSNTVWPREWHDGFLRRDGVFELFDGTVYSSELPWAKPHPEAFRAAMNAIGVDDPARCLFVGDRPFDDIWGAQQLGMRTALVPYSVVEHVDVTPDVVVTGLADLLGYLDSLLAEPEA